MLEDTKETPDVKEGATQQEDVVTFNLPKVVKVGYTDPITGEKVVREKNISDLTPAEIVSAIQKSDRFEQKMGDINREIEKKAIELAEKLADTKAEAKAQQLLAEIKRRETIINDEMLEKIKEGDSESLLKIIKAQQEAVNDLRDLVVNMKKDMEISERLYREYNENIEKALNEYPDVDEKTLVDFVKRTKIDPELIGEAARTFSLLAKRDIDITKLNQKQRKELEEKVKKSLESVPPPPIEGDAISKKEKMVDTSLEGMLDAAMKILEEERNR